jgi:hypothetical protein
MGKKNDVFGYQDKIIFFKNGFIGKFILHLLGVSLGITYLSLFVIILF